VLEGVDGGAHDENVDALGKGVAAVGRYYALAEFAHGHEKEGELGGRRIGRGWF